MKFENVLKILSQIFLVFGSVATVHVFMDSKWYLVLAAPLIVLWIIFDEWSCRIVKERLLKNEAPL
jgi:hypothetical protein